MTDLVEALRDFFSTRYLREVAPILEQETGLSFGDIPAEQVPVLGLVVGGFSYGAYLSEVWQILIPEHSAPT
jgi:hypothetical protein